MENCWLVDRRNGFIFDLGQYTYRIISDGYYFKLLKPIGWIEKFFLLKKSPPSIK